MTWFLGIIHGHHSHQYVALEVKRLGRDRSGIFVIFLVDCASPFTHLSARTFWALSEPTTVTPSNEVVVVVHGKEEPVYVTKDLNVLGATFFQNSRLMVTADYKSNLLKLDE